MTNLPFHRLRGRRFRSASLACIACALAATALATAGRAAAQLNHSGSLPGSTVRLSDLFSGLEPGQDCELGPAPEPGRSVVIGGEQLTAIAAQFAVDWSGASTARLTLTRPGRALSMSEMQLPLHDALVAAGAPATLSMKLAPFSPPTVAIGTTETLSVAQMDYDPQHGRFSAQVEYEIPGEEPRSFRVTGRVMREVSLVVASHDLSAGEALNESALRMNTTLQAVGADDGAFVRDANTLVGLSLRHGVSAGAPISIGDTERLPLVRRGGSVRVSLASATGLMLGATFRALQSGAVGDDVRLVNPTSGAIVVAKIRADGSAEIQIGTMPVGTAKPWEMTGQSDGVISASPVGRVG